MFLKQMMAAASMFKPRMSDEAFAFATLYWVKLRAFICMAKGASSAQTVSYFQYVNQWVVYYARFLVATHDMT